MSLDNTNVASGDRAVATAGPTVSLEQFADFGALTQGKNSADVSALGFPSFQMSNISDMLDRCQSMGSDASSCVKSVKRHSLT